MIRDPSDGSVKSAPDRKAPQHAERLPKREPASSGAGTDPVIEAATSGLQTGSVREVTPEEDTLLRKALVASGTVVQPVLETDTSGLPIGSNKPENLARLQLSREWLADYHAKKNVKPE